MPLTDTLRSKTRRLITNHALSLTGGVIVFTVLALWLSGQPLICECGYVNVLDDGLGEQGSQHLFDWYTLHHVIRGFLTYAALRYAFPSLSFRVSLLAAVSLEAAWELVENSPFVIERYRQTANTEYVGDAVINSLTDILGMIAGYVFAAQYRWWTTLILGTAFELLTLWVIRDSLALNIIMLLYPFEAVREWQLALWQ